MKLYLFSILVSAVCISATCNTASKNLDCYRGRLEIKGICSNYTIKLLEGSLDTSQVAATWTNEHTGKKYENVFALGSPCSFPTNIAEGEEFSFMLAPAKDTCAVCMAYYPKPEKALSIRVVPACN